MNESDVNSVLDGGIENTLELDLSEYYPYLEEFDLTEAQQIELLQALWNIMASMVDMGWGVDNIQLMLPDLFNQESEAGKVKAHQKIEKKGSPNDL